MGEITPAIIVFSRTIKDAVETHPEGVVTSTSIVIEEVYGRGGVYEAVVCVAVVVIVSAIREFIENTYVAPPIPPAVAVNVKLSSSHIMLFSLSELKVAFTFDSIFTVIGVLVDEQAVGSGLPATRGLLYTTTLTSSPSLIETPSATGSKLNVVKPGSESVVSSAMPCTRNLNDCPPVAVKFNVSSEQTVIVVEAPPTFELNPGTGFGDTVILTDAVGAEQGTPNSVPITSLL